MEGADHQQVAGVAAQPVEEMVDAQGLAAVHRLRAGEHAGDQHREGQRRHRPAEERHEAERAEDDDQDQGLDHPDAGSGGEHPPAGGEPLQRLRRRDLARLG